MKLKSQRNTCIQEATSSGSDRPVGSIDSDFVGFHRAKNGRGCAVILMDSLEILDGNSSGKDKLVAFIAHEVTDSQFLAIEQFSEQLKADFDDCSIPPK